VLQISDINNSPAIEATEVMMYAIGRKIVVTASVPYFESDRPATFFELIITKENKMVPGDYDPSKLHTGYLAVDSSGREYEWAWTRWPDTSSSGPCWCRYIPDEVYKKMTEDEKEEAIKIDTYLIRDVTNFAIPKAPSFLEQYPQIKYCEPHQTIRYEWDKCFLCEHKIALREEMKIKLAPIKRPYNGWFD
jgi:hypothetical protein